MEKIPISNVCLGGYMITSKTKMKVFLNIFYLLQVPFGDPPPEKFQKMLILAIEANSALSCQQNGLFFRGLVQCAPPPFARQTNDGSRLDKSRPYQVHFPK